MFEGKDTDSVRILNDIYHIVSKLRYETKRNNCDIDYIPHIVIYVGDLQLHALYSIDNHDRYAIKGNKFIGADIVRVCLDDHFRAFVIN